MNNSSIIEKFYSSFAKADAEGMVSCYHDDIRFEDPAFGVLHGEDAKKMWRMLIKSSKGEIDITYSDVQADEHAGSANWVAKYVFSKTGRNVVNRISAQFEFKDGKIIKHTDTFDIWKWAGQALGMPGKLLGWSSFMKNKIRKTTTGLLASYKG